MRLVWASQSVAMGRGVGREPESGMGVGGQRDARERRPSNSVL